MSYRRKVISDYPNCYKKIRFKDNYNLKGSYNLIFEDVDIYQAECIKVINEKIIDYITVEDFKYRVEEKGEFKIVNSFNYKYNEGDSISIDKISINYDFIGMIESEKKELVDFEKVIFSAKSGTGYKCCEETFYDKFTANVYTAKFNSSINKKNEVKSRVLENEAQFYICNLQVILFGTIGKQEFKAISSTTPYTGIIFEDVGLDFCGKIYLPEEYKKVTIHEEYDGFLTAECAIADSEYDFSSNTFTASVEFLLDVKKTIYSTVNEKMDIFTVPNLYI